MVRITDREERLVSKGKLQRAFIAYDNEAHLVFGRVEAMEYAEVAKFLKAHFQKRFGSSVMEAMCLDGGSSAQVVYQKDGQFVDAAPAHVTVPTAVLLVPKSQQP
jgi:exopolysaccharide biosynthesis protein